MGYPDISTWCKSIDVGYFWGWPILTSSRLFRHIKFTIETEMGHMYQQRQVTHSTKHTTITKKKYSMTPVPQTKTNYKTHHVYMKITNLSGKLYSDRTGRFPVTSSRGNCYVVIFYTLYGNHIKSYPINSQHIDDLLKSYDEVYSYLRFRGYCPQLHKLENETSKDIENFIT